MLLKFNNFFKKTYLRKKLGTWSAYVGRVTLLGAECCLAWLVMCREIREAYSTISVKSDIFQQLESVKLVSADAMQTSNLT